MIIFGEKLNSSIPSTLSLFSGGDDNAISALCKKQEECGADYLDINTAMLGENEKEAMKHIAQLACDNTSCGIMLDSADTAIFSEILPTLGDRKVILNSITLDERHELIDLCVKFNTGIVVLPINENGIPDTADELFENAAPIIKKLTDASVDYSRIYVDLIIESIATNSSAFMRAKQFCELLRENYPDIHITCGLSNISFGLPKRININQAAIPALICSGLDTAIVDITNDKVRSMISASRVLSGEDEYCMDYIDSFRTDDN